MTKGALGALALLLVLCPGAPAAEDWKARAARLQKSAIVVDTHEDVPEQLEKEWVDIGTRQKTGHVDIPRWKEGGVTAPFLAAYVSAGYAASGTAAKKALEFIDLIHRLAEAHPDLRFADSVAGIRAAKADGKIAVLVGIEGGHTIEDSLGALSAFYRLGARYMTLTHTNTNHWADSAGSFFTFGFDPKKPAVHNGLTDFGRQVVLEMNRLGMLVDVSHVSEQTMADVLAVSKAPVFASHSSCRALCSLPRNMTDDMLRALARNGGVVGINFSGGFLNQKEADEDLKTIHRIGATEPNLTGKALDDYTAKMHIHDDWAHPKPTVATLADAVAHVDHAIKVAGIDHVGIGSDFDGISEVPKGLEDESKMPALTAELLKKGYSEGDIKKIMGENFLRVMRQVIGR